jgi:hypothetical protein
MAHQSDDIRLASSPGPTSVSRLSRDIKDQENKSGRTFVSFPPRKLEPNQAPQPTVATRPASQMAAASDLG